MALLQHPAFEHDVRDVPDSQVKEWEEAGWKKAPKSVEPPITQEPEPQPEPDYQAE